VVQNAENDKITMTERKSPRELVTTRLFDAPPSIVFEAWSTPALFRRWWVPKSLGATLVSCEMDVRVGGRYRLVFGHPSSDQTMAFHGQYLEVVPAAKLVWTNEESGENGAVTSVTFCAKGGQTLLVLSELYPTPEALERSQGGAEGLPEQFMQLEALLASIT
jgi:uncharacterized protein YndB with AHSA1/START domain